MLSLEITDRKSGRARKPKKLPPEGLGVAEQGVRRRAFQKLLLNFTWWVDREDIEGNNMFSGAFLVLDNIGVFDRSKPLPTGGFLPHAVGTAWMGFYCLRMLSIALELAEMNRVYEDMASKFFEHFIGIPDAMNALGGSGLWGRGRRLFL